MSLTEHYVQEHLGEFQQLSVSTNRVYRFTCEGVGHIVKVNNMRPEQLSPFWYSIREVFGSDFSSQRKNMKQLLRKLQNPHIAPAELVFTSERYRFLVFREARGMSYEPDEFPNSSSVARRLGQYVGYLHQASYDRYGAYPPQKAKAAQQPFKVRMLHVMGELIQRYWREDEAVLAYFEQVCKIRVEPESYSLIMPDNSANQFLFTEDLSQITAVVDFDAYVIGPRELELSVLELCLPDGQAFQRGYEEYRPLPDLTQILDFYRFFIYLCDPWVPGDLHSFLDKARFWS